MGTKLADTLNWKYSECDAIGIERKTTRNDDVTFCSVKNSHSQSTDRASTYQIYYSTELEEIAILQNVCLQHIIIIVLYYNNSNIFL